MHAADLKALAAGAAAWAAAVPIVKLVGPTVASGKPAAKAGILLLCLGISAATTPLLARVLGWRSPSERVRGIALALGMAQCVDGLVHFVAPTFYSNDAHAALGSAGAVFFAAGTLGIFSAF